MKLFNTILGILLLIAVIFLFVKVYGDKPDADKDSKTVNNSESLEEGNFNNISVAYINMDTLNENYAYQDEMRLKLENRFKSLEADIANQSRVLQEGMTNLQQQAPNLSDEQIQREQQELMTRERQLRMYSEQKSNELALEQEELNRLIYEDLEEILGGIRAEYDLDFILRKDIGGSVLSADDQFDITAMVVKRLNDKHNKRKAAKENKSAE